MDLANSYFLITSDKNLSNDKKARLEEIAGRVFETAKGKIDFFLDSFSILLATNENNIDEFNELDSSKSIYKEIDLDSEKFDLNSLTELKVVALAVAIELINQKCFSQSEIDLVNQNITNLKDVGFLERIKFLKLKTLVNNLLPKEKKELKVNIEEAKKADINERDRAIYNAKVSKLLEVIEKISTKIEAKELRARLEAIPNRLKNSKFSIGITGVMNAGKSTMLNAMLKKDILGTSVIPETANLSIIKYSKEEFAKVFFWRSSEWAKIKESGSLDENIKEFVSDTEEVFGESLNEYITDKGVAKEIPLHELGNYTSAKLSEMKCNLVKSVELYSDLEFVEGGVEIVDTPGIDDPVTQREDITKEYLSKCDVMLHLMNANQSATEKDIDFIIDAILYQNISRLLVVITRIDTVSEGELSEVIKYTKESIKNQLSKINKDGAIDSILEKIDFVPIAGKMALLHRLGRSDETKGYSIEQSGILEVEKYLSKILFGEDSEKAKLIIDGNRKEIESSLNSYVKMLELEYENIGKSIEEFESELKNYQRDKNKILSKLSNIKSEISSQEDDISSYMKNLETFVDNEARYFKGVIEKRLIANISYDYKNKKEVDLEAIKFIIEFGIKDGLFDIVRDYKYQLQSKVSQSIELIEQNYLDFESQTSEVSERNFDVKELFSSDFASGFLSESNSFLISKINTIISKYSKRSIEKMEVDVKEVLKVAFEQIAEATTKKSKDVNSFVMESFLNIVLEPSSKIEANLNDKENLIKAQIERITKKSQSDEERKLEIENQIESMSSILEEIKDI